MSQHGQSAAKAVQPHLLCADCKSFWGRATCLNFTSGELSQGGQDVPSMPQYLLHSNSQLAIRVAADSGCHFCSIIIGCLTGCTGDHEDRKNHRSEDPLYISINLQDQQEGTFLLILFPCEESKISDSRMDYALHLSPIKSGDPESIPTDELVASRAQTSTYSEATAELIRSWILQCQAKHPVCGEKHYSLLHGPSPPIPRPRRLLDLQAFQTPGRIRLIEAENEPGLPYCALSYSWGFSKPYVLTMLNLREFQNEIHLSNLPKTFQDAVEVVRGIGLRYLWTDALCILQDGETSPVASDDWFDQAGKMSDIFGNSLITIAASEAHDGSQGFITSRNPLSHTICRLNLETNLCFEVIPPCTPFCLAHPFDNAQYHLDTRAWVLQERLLSPRTIHFTRNFVHLECRTEIKCEAISQVANCHHRGSHVKLDYQNLFGVLFGLTIEGIRDIAVESLLSTWHVIVRKYSTTNLSRASDLLVALSGLMKPLRDNYQLTWSFGLCRDFMLREMLWYVRGGRGMPSRDRAPTWSWASIDVRGPEIIYEPSILITLAANITALPEVTTFTRQPPLSAHESKFGVKVVGRLKFGVPSSMKPRSSEPSSTSLRSRNNVCVHRFCRGMPWLHPECPFHPDHDLPDSMHLYSLLVAHGSDQSLPTGFLQTPDIEIGLVLTPVAEHRRRYRRVGYFHHSLQDETDIGHYKPLPSFFDERCRMQEIEIV